MGEKALEVYQGNDWLTYRWPVAQVFDTLDRIRDLCHSLSPVGGAIPQLPVSSAPRYDVPMEDERLNLFVGIIELCDDLSGEMDTLLADLSSFMQKEMKLRWMGFEMRLHLTEMRTIALLEHQAYEPSGHAVDAVLALAARIRDLLRQVDQ